MRAVQRSLSLAAVMAVLSLAACDGGLQGPSSVGAGSASEDPAIVRAQASPVPVPGGGPSPEPSRSPSPAPSASPTPTPTPKPSATPAPVPLLVTQLSRPAYRYCEASRKAVCPTLHGDTDWKAIPFDFRNNEGRIVTLNSHATSTARPLVTFKVTRAVRVQVFFNNVREDAAHGSRQACGADGSSFWPQWADAAGWVSQGASEDSTRSSSPSQAATFTAREKSFAAGQTVSLGPNLLRNCEHGYQARMYYVRVVPASIEALP